MSRNALFLVGLAVFLGCVEGVAAQVTSCEREFRRVAAIDDLQDTVTDLDQAARVCESVEQWRQMAAKYPDAVEPDIAVIFLTNRCALAEIDSPLCRQVLGNSASLPR